MSASETKTTIDASRVLVPVSNPATARGLIQLARSLADPETGRVWALLVQPAVTDGKGQVYEALTAIVEGLDGGGPPVELVTRTSPSVARGILDAALEYGVTLMVLGFQTPGGGRPTLGPVVEAVARTAPCDLIVYRNPSRQPMGLEDVSRVIMPLDGSDNSQVAARLGLALAEAYDAQPLAIYVQTDPDLPSWFGLARIEAALAGLGETQRITRQVVQARDPAEAILTRAGPNDLIVVGYSERSPLDRWIFGNLAQRVLASAPGPAVLAKRAAGPRLTLGEQLRRRWLGRFSPRLTPDERADILRQAHEMSIPGINFFVLMLLSSLLASFGLLQNNVAVIIGAMLVAPLMAPLMAISVGLLQGDFRLVWAASQTALFGVVIGLGVAVLGGLIMPANLVTQEMISRGQPSLLDMGIALASGAAGAYAVARRDIPSALAGVAIAAALVPPLCTAGLAIAFGDMALASGAGLLFVTNIVSISLVGALVFTWLGVRPLRAVATYQQVIVLLILLGLLAIPLGSTFIDVTRTKRETGIVQQVLQNYFSDAEVITVDVRGNDVRATIRSSDEITASDARSAEQQIEQALNRNVNLEITFWRAFRPGM